MTENSDNDMAPPIVLSNTSMLKSSGKPKSIVWGNHIKQGKQISKDIGVRHAIIATNFGTKVLLLLSKNTKVIHVKMCPGCS